MKPSTTSATPSIVSPAQLASLSAWRRSAGPGVERYFAISNRPCSSRARRVIVTLSEARAAGRFEAEFESISAALSAIAAGSIHWHPVPPTPIEPVDPQVARLRRRLSRQVRTPLA